MTSQAASFCRVHLLVAVSTASMMSLAMLRGRGCLVIGLLRVVGEDDRESRIDLMVAVLMPPALSWIVIDPGFTAIEITGAASASSQASSALSMSSLSTTKGHS